MILESFFIPHIFARRIERLVARLIGHFEDTGSRPGCARQKPAVQTMPGVLGRIQIHLAGEFLDDERHTLGRQPRSADVTAPVQPPKEGTGADLCHRLPVEHRAHRAVGRVFHPRDSHALALALLVGRREDSCRKCS